MPAAICGKEQDSAPDETADNRNSVEPSSDPEHGQEFLDLADLSEPSIEEPTTGQDANTLELDVADKPSIHLPEMEDDAYGGIKTPSVKTEDLNSTTDIGSSTFEGVERNNGQDSPSERQQDGPPEKSDPSIQKYRPRLRSKPELAPTMSSKAPQQQPEASVGTLEAALLLTFLPGDWGISLSVLLSRADEMSECLDVRIGEERFSLYAIDDRLFEPIQPSNVDLVSSGFSAETDGGSVRRWVRTRRDLHTFSHRSGVSGFATVPRVLIGQENVVLCKSELGAIVVDCASATGSNSLIRVEGPGILDDWVCFRGYRPQRPAELGDIDEIFQALNPHPDAAVELSEGIAIARGIWIAGAPPAIRVLGASPGPGDLTIDGVEGTQSPDEIWTAPGWDSLGSHTIRFSSLSRNYEIAQIDEAWPNWVTSDGAALSTCGARISAADGTQALAIRGGPFWLLGAVAGDLVFARRTSYGFSIGAPRFRPVWAVSPVGSGRQAPARILAHRSEPQTPAVSRTRQEIQQWCLLLRGAAAPRDVDAKELWREYRKLARSLRRNWR